MSRRRYLSTDISTDRRVNQMGMKYGDGPVLFYTWVIPHCEDDGTITADPWELLGIVWAARRDKTEEDVRQAIAACEEFGLLERSADGRRLQMPVDAWLRYQTYIPSAKRDAIRAQRQAGRPPASDHRETPQITEDHRITPTNAEEPRTSAKNAASPSPSPSPSPSLSPSPSPVEPPPQEASPPGPPRVAGGDGLATASPAGTERPEPVPRRARASARAPRLPPDLRRLVGEWRAAVVADGLAPPRDWHLRASGYVRRWVQAGATVADLRAWWAWLHDDPWWATRYPEVALWDRAWSQWRLRAHAPPRARPPGELSGAAAVDALLAGLTRQEGGRDDPG